MSLNLRNPRINQLDFYNLFNTLTSDEKKAIIGYELTYHIGSDSYKYYIREISNDGKSIKICRSLTDPFYKDLVEDDDEIIVSRHYNWRQFDLRKRKKATLGFKYVEKDIKDQMFRKPSELKEVIYRGYSESGYLDFNGGVDYRDPSF